MKNIKEEFNKYTFLLMLIAILINVIGGAITKIFNWPIYLDAIGTILVSLLGGPWVGALTGVLSNLTSGLFLTHEIPFAIVSAFIGFTAGVLAQHNAFLYLQRRIVSSLVISIVTVIMSIVVRVEFYGDKLTNDNTSAMVEALINYDIPFWTAQTIVQILSEIPDKLLSILIVVMIIQKLSKTTLEKFPIGSLYINE